MLSQIKSEQTKEKMQKFKINKSEFEELTSDIYDHQNKKDFKITINKKTWQKNVQRIDTKDFDVLKREKSSST